MTNGLIDLDELVLKCRHDRARSFVQEAVACYKSGAYRAAIVSTWAAVCFDYIHKIHELDIAGDKRARVHAQTLDRIRKNPENNYKLALDFEKMLLTCAKTELELLTDLEYQDLERLRQDRNRCAHPTMQSEAEPYSPTPELARTHLRNAVELFLQREPVQGQHALDRVLANVDSDYFPEKLESAILTLSNGPMKRPRYNLLVAFTQRLVFDYFENSGKEQTPKRKRILTALDAVRTMHPDDFSRALSERRTQTILENVPDEKLLSLLRFLRWVPGIWERCTNSLQIKCIEFLKSGPPESKGPRILFGLHINELCNEALLLIPGTNGKDLAGIIANDPDKSIVANPEIIKRAVCIFQSASSFDVGRKYAEYLILPIAEFLAPEQIAAILSSVSGNHNLHDNWEVPNFLSQLFEKTTVHLESTKGEWQSFYSKVKDFDADYSVLSKTLEDSSLV